MAPTRAGIRPLGCREGSREAVKPEPRRAASHGSGARCSPAPESGRTAGTRRYWPGGFLSRERYGSRPYEGAGELREDRQVRVKPDSLDASRSQREQRPLVLEPTELALDGGAALVELASARCLARHERVQAVGLNPPGRAQPPELTREERRWLLLHIHPPPAQAVPVGGVSDRQIRGSGEPARLTTPRYDWSSESR